MSEEDTGAPHFATGAEVEALLDKYARDRVGAHTRMQCKVCWYLWRTRIINNAGKTLLDAYVIAKVPPEIPISAEEFADGAAKCTDLIEWVRHDLQRGTLGGGEIKAEEVLNV